MTTAQSIFGKNKCPHCLVTVFLPSSYNGLIHDIDGDLARLLLNLPKL